MYRKPVNPRPFVFARWRSKSPVEPKVCTIRGYAKLRKRADYDPQLITHYCPDENGQSSPATRARARVTRTREGDA